MRCWVHMLTAIIPLVFCLFAFVFLKNKQQTMIDSVVYSSVSVGLLVLLSVESLSLGASINVRMVVLWWAGQVAILLLYLGVNRGVCVEGPPQRHKVEFRSLGLDEKIYFLYILLLLLSTGIIAWAAPPNTFDSMTYHMSRVMHWIQNQSVDFYPTTILRQLLSAPWAEYAILHTVVLGGTDRLANFVQWSCMAGSLVVAAGVAREFGATRYGQVFAALFCAALPMGILQSTSTQNDYVVGFWLLCFIFQVLKFRRTRKLFDGVFLGCALGLAVLTKPTAYVFALPFVLWLVLDTLFTAGSKRTAQLLACLSLALVVNACHFYRNYEFSGTPLGQTLDSGDYSYENAVFGPSVLVSNALRNIGLHLETGTRLDRLSQRFIERAHSWIDISINDKRTTWPEYDFRVQGQKHHEDYAGNFWQVVLILVCIFLYLIFLKKSALITIYMLLLVVAFLIFCGVLRWQPWHSRLHLPLFLLWAPVIGLIMEQMREVRLKDFVWLRFPLLEQRMPTVGRALDAVQQIKFCAVAGLILIVASLPSLYLSETKPLLGERSIFSLPRESQLFYVAPHMAEGYLETADLIAKAGCTKIALYGFSNDWEYPVWALAKTHGAAALEIRHVMAALVTPTGKPLAGSGINKSFEPCAVITPSTMLESNLNLSGMNYQQVYSSKAIKLFQ
jgi:hypothetical protein